MSSLMALPSGLPNLSDANPSGQLAAENGVLGLEVLDLEGEDTVGGGGQQQQEGVEELLHGPIAYHGYFVGRRRHI